MSINQFTQPRKAWIIIGERCPNYTVKFINDPTLESTRGTIPVIFTPQQAKFVRKFQKAREQYETLCKELTKG